MCAKFSIDYSQFEELERNVAQLPNRAEKVINDTLKVKVSPVLEKSILGLIRISNKKKKHARFFKSLSSDNKENLTITIRPKKKYGYLVFPDLGVGTSIKNGPQHFMDHGVEQKTDYAIKELNLSLIEEINKTLGGQ